MEIMLGNGLNSLKKDLCIYMDLIREDSRKKKKCMRNSNLMELQNLRYQEI